MNVYVYSHTSAYMAYCVSHGITNNITDFKGKITYSLFLYTVVL